MMAPVEHFNPEQEPQATRFDFVGPKVSLTFSARWSTADHASVHVSGRIFGVEVRGSCWLWSGKAWTEGRALELESEHGNPDRLREFGTQAERMEGLAPGWFMRHRGLYRADGCWDNASDAARKAMREALVASLPALTAKPARLAGGLADAEDRLSRATEGAAKAEAALVAATAELDAAKAHLRNARAGRLAL